jgi:hypothetical protein
MVLRWRSPTAILIQAFFSVGEVVLAGLAFGLPGWRAQTLVVSALFAPLLVGSVTVLVESPMWLHSTGATEAALEQLRVIAAGNGTALPPTITLKPPSQGAASVSVATLLRHSVLRPRLLIMAFAWYTCSFVYYGLSLATSTLSGNPYVNFAWQAVAEVPALVAAMYAIDTPRLGRRGSLKWGLWLTCSAATALAVCSGAPPESRTFLAMMGECEPTRLVQSLPSMHTGRADNNACALIAIKENRGSQRHLR